MIIMSSIRRFFEEEKAQIKRLGNTMEEELFGTIRIDR